MFIGNMMLCKTTARWWLARSLVQL